MQTHPRPFRLRRRFGAVAAATGLVLTGCNAGSDGAGDDGSVSADETTATTQYESPIADFLGVDYNFDEDNQQEFIDEANAAEQRIAECMRAEGFEYTPVDQGQYMSFGSGTEDGLEYGSRAWTEKYGFGASTQMFSQSDVGPDLVGWDDSQMPGEGEEFNDPNQDYVMTLPEDEQAAYYEALYGDEPEITEGMTDEEINDLYAEWESTGCQNVGWEGSWEESPEGRFYTTFDDDLQDLYERMEADPRIVEALREAEACVVEAGQPWLEDEEQWEYFQDKLGGIGGYSDEDPFASAGLDPESMTDEEMEAFWNDLSRLDDADRALLAEVQAEEIEMALVYFDCKAGWQGRDEIFNEVRIEYEEQFLTEHADELAEFEGAGAGD